MTAVPCYLSHVVIDENADHQTVFLAEQGGARRFPIPIGTVEAHAIDRAVRGQAFPRPLTHDLAVALVKALGGAIERVEITDLRDGTFYARVVLTGDRAVDARPSDALALLVRSPGVPLLVAAAVLAEACP